MITLTTPITQPALDKKRLLQFAADIPNHRITVIFEQGALTAGDFTPTSRVQRTFTDDTTPSFNDFIAACPATGNLRRQVETYEVTLAQPGTVD